ncbi:MAG: hypothetical protein HXX18_13765 [Bacteroidetes bacterium]|nr:hypothetical protein [Bacteroidota bacterium]
MAIEIPANKKVEIKIHRYEKVLMSVDANNLKNELKKYKAEYMLFLDGNIDDTLNIIKLYNFISDPTLHEIYDDLIKVYPETSGLEKKLSDAFTHLKYYFPEKTTPKVYTYISYLDYENRIIYLDSVMAIALDMYLGADYKMYPSVKIPKFISMRLDSNFITSDCMKSIAKQMITFDSNDKTLLDNMIYQGKILYFTDAMLPEVDENVKIGYSLEQFNWSKKNEANLWAFFIQNNLLFNADYYKIRSFITEAPTTKGFKNSPPRLAEWLGWQIVKSFMDNNKNVTLKDLLKENDAQKILKASKYKPNKT